MQLPNCAELLNLSGELLEGVSFGDRSTLLSLGSRTSKPHCAVYSWIVFDVEEDGSACDLTFINPSKEGSAQAYVESVVPPLVLFSHYVVFHSTGRFARGDSIRSGYAIGYDGRGIFETEDTIYVLFGKGFRRCAPGDAINSLPEGVVDVDYSELGRQEHHVGSRR